MVRGVACNLFKNSYTAWFGVLAHCCAFTSLGFRSLIPPLIALIFTLEWTPLVSPFFLLSPLNLLFSLQFCCIDLTFLTAFIWVSWVIWFNCLTSVYWHLMPKRKNTYYYALYFYSCKRTYSTWKRAETWHAAWTLHNSVSNWTSVRAEHEVTSLQHMLVFLLFISSHTVMFRMRQDHRHTLSNTVHH